MLIDGNVEYACIANQARHDQLDPLPNLPVIRDLIANTLSNKETLAGGPVDSK
jgi:succinate dehydrogenase/fumarate reductase-like Fe-S protein